jgi:probable HAF family extracellular repeat protein
MHKAKLHTTFAAVPLLAAIATGQSYEFVDLGTLGGSASGGDGINESGRVTGWSKDFSGAYYGFLSNASGTSLTNLGPPPNGSYSYGQAVNDLGVVVGYADVNVGFGVEDRAFRWANGIMIDLGTLGGDASQAYDINNAGLIVGTAEVTGGGSQAFLWQNGIMTELASFPGGYADNIAYGINQLGTIVGQSYDAFGVRHPVMWRGSQIDTLELPPTSSGGRAYSVNDLNQAVGNGWYQGNTTTPIVWDENGFATELSHWRGHYYGVAYDINNHGQVVGTTYNSNTPAAPLLWENGIAFNLSDLVELPPGFFGMPYAYEINDAGQIVGTASASGGFRAYRLDPIPGALGVSGPDPGRAGQINEFRVRGATPGATVFLVYGLNSGSTPVPGCPGLSSDIGQAVLGATTSSNGIGHAIFSSFIPTRADNRTIHFQAIERSTCRTSNTIIHRFL